MQNSVKVWQLSLKNAESNAGDAWDGSSTEQIKLPPKACLLQGSFLPKKTRSRTLTARHKFHSDYPCQVLHSTVGSIHFSCSQTKIPSSLQACPTWTRTWYVWKQTSNTDNQRTSATNLRSLLKCKLQLPRPWNTKRNRWDCFPQEL